MEGTFRVLSKQSRGSKRPLSSNVRSEPPKLSRKQSSQQLTGGVSQQKGITSERHSSLQQQASGRQSQQQQTGGAARQQVARALISLSSKVPTKKHEPRIYYKKRNTNPWTVLVGSKTIANLDTKQNAQHIVEYYEKVLKETNDPQKARDYANKESYLLKNKIKLQTGGASLENKKYRRPIRVVRKRIDLANVNTQQDAKQVVKAFDQIYDQAKNNLAEAVKNARDKAKQINSKSKSKKSKK